MVRKLFILRHGEAESGRNWTDINRPLTDQGKKDVLIVGAKLNIKGIRFDHVLCSTARRTRETASLFLEPFTEQPNLTFREELYNATLDEVQREIMNIPRNYTSVALIGHNPSVSSLATSCGAGGSSSGPSLRRRAAMVAMAAMAGVPL